MAGNVEKKKSPVALILVLILVIAALAVALIVLLNKQKDSDNGNGITASDAAEPVKRNAVINEDNVDELLENMAEEARVSAGSYEVTMNTTWQFPDGKSASSNAYVENSVANTNDVYFDVLMAGTEDVIFSSPLLPLGSHIENVTLDKELSKGTYDCVVKYTLVDEDQNPLSDVQVGLTIIVES